ncbi:MAG: hypothetical protein IPP32_04075 [Bacteroidetes bacterium]|nr:hypothetical protein [Bacteroidota bacterium]
MMPKSKAFLTGKKISSREEWETNFEDWMSRTEGERLTAIEILRQQYLELFGKSKHVDMTVFGLRK